MWQKHRECQEPQEEAKSEILGSLTATTTDKSLPSLAADSEWETGPRPIRGWGYGSQCLRHHHV